MWPLLAEMYEIGDKNSSHSVCIRPNLGRALAGPQGQTLLLPAKCKPLPESAPITALTDPHIAPPAHPKQMCVPWLSTHHVSTGTNSGKLMAERPHLAVSAWMPVYCKPGSSGLVHQKSRRTRQSKTPYLHTCFQESPG